MPTPNTNHRTLWLLLASALAVILPYAWFTHPFEVPDENAHYASLHFLANEGRMPTRRDADNLSLEEGRTEEIFGISEGKNAYSYHPDFRIEQIAGTTGKYEDEIIALNTASNRQTYATHGSALYPPLYYRLTLPFYELVSQGDILTRLFVSRLASVFLTGLMIIVAYAIGKLIFGKEVYARTLAVLTLFFPMTAYLGAGVNSDNLHNLLFSLALLLALRLIKQGASPQLATGIGVCIGLDLLTKPQAYILFPIFALAILVRARVSEWKSTLISLLYCLIPILLLAGGQEIPKLIGRNPYIAHDIAYSGWDNFRVFTRGYLHTHLSEMPVWYFGVFKWFGVILPRPWWWIGIRLFGAASLGLIIKIVKDLRNHVVSWESRLIIFFVGANCLYAASLYWFDWQFYEQFGRSLGLQARYYLPLLIAQLALVLMGLTSLGWNERVREIIRRGLLFFFLGLQVTGLVMQLGSYYDLGSWGRFLEEVSQYKPFFAKGDWWYLWCILYVTGSIAACLLALRSISPTVKKRSTP